MMKLYLNTHITQMKHSKENVSSLNAERRHEG